MSQAEQLAVLKKQYKGYKANFTRKLDGAALDLSQSESFKPSRVIVDQLNSNLAEVKSAFKRLEACLNQLEELDLDQFDAYEAKLEENDKRTKQIVSKLVARISEVEHQLSAPGDSSASDATSASGAVASNTSAVDVRPAKLWEKLTPKVLVREATPVELTQWIARLEDYYHSTRLERADLREQQAHFKSLIDHYLQSRLSGDIKDDTTVLDDNSPSNLDKDGKRINKSCLDYLRAQFLVEHPLFSRRLAYFRYQQSSGQAFTAWAAKLDELGDEADLANVNAEVIKTMRYFTGVTDANLKTEFLKTPGKDWKELREVALDYEMGKRYNKTIVAQTAATSSGKKGARKTTSAHQDQKKWSCFRCGKVCKEREEQVAHVSQCKAKDKTCKNCNKLGHFAQVCNALNKGPSSKGGSGGPSAAKAATPSAPGGATAAATSAEAPSAAAANSTHA